NMLMEGETGAVLRTDDQFDRITLANEPRSLSGVMLLQFAVPSPRIKTTAAVLSATRGSNSSRQRRASPGRRVRMLAARGSTGSARHRHAGAAQPARRCVRSPKNSGLKRTSYRTG